MLAPPPNRKSLLRRPFDAALHPLASPMMQPVHRLLNFRERNGVFAAGKRSGLKTLQAMLDDGQQRFAADAVHASFFDGAVLEFDHCLTAA